MAESPAGSLAQPYNLDRLRLRQLALIATLNQTGNLHRAAQAIGLSQPAATKMLREIEATLRVPLFERHARGMVPTPFGIAVARHAELMLSNLRKMHREITDLQEGLQGTVHIGAIMAAEPDLIVEAFALIAHQHPTVSVTLLSGSSDMMAEALRSHRIDLMLGRHSGPRDTETMAFEPLMEEELSIVVGLRHPLLRRTVLNLEDLVTERWILHSPPSPLRRHVELAFSRLDLPLPPHPVETASMLTTVALLAQTELVACIPTSVARYFSGLGAVAILPVKLPNRLTPFCLVTLKDQVRTPAIDYVMATLRKVARGVT